MSLRSFLEEVEGRGEVLRVKKPLSPRFEIPMLLKKVDGGPVVLFEDVAGYGMMVAAGFCGSRRRICEALKVDESRLHDFIEASLLNPAKCRRAEEAPIKEVYEKVDLGKFPILTHYERDPAPYITSGVVVARDVDEGFQNVSFHRLQVVDRSRAAIRLVEGRHLHHMYRRAQRRGKPLPIAVVIGLHPAVMLAAACSPPLGVDELSIANRMLNEGLLTTRCEHTNIDVPAEAEVVFEGEIVHDRSMDEGPFVDILGTYDIVRKQPIVEFTGVMRRKDSFYQALLPAGCEHELLMGLPREAAIWSSIRKVTPEVRKVRLTLGGCSWLHAVVSIKKEGEGDPRNVMMAAFSAHPSLKYVVVVDEDIDPEDPSDVEWALATRMQGDEDIMITPRARGSSLDPSANQESLLTAKVGIDATRPLYKPKEIFERAKIPGERDV